MPPEIGDLNDYVVDSWPSTEEGEARQADELVRHYRSVLAHPAVESLTYWGLTDDGAWLGAPSGLLRRDGSRKPGYDALRALVRASGGTPRRPRGPASGVVPLRGFAGRYRVTAGGTWSRSGVGAGPRAIVQIEGGRRPREARTAGGRMQAEHATRELRRPRHPRPRGPSRQERAGWLHAGSRRGSTRRATTLVALAEAETHLGVERLRGEVARTTDQLRLFADVLEEGSDLEATLEPIGGRNRLAGDPPLPPPARRGRGLLRLQLPVRLLGRRRRHRVRSRGGVPGGRQGALRPP